MKHILLGDEAIAQGAIDAGLSGVYAYPGTPSTEITEYIQLRESKSPRGIFCQWATNEKTAMEAALGMTYAGKRALVCMKHVGMNVCADAFVNSAITGVNGGLVVVAADDPSMHSSQNEQDSRFYAKFALIPCFEPSNQQEAYDMTRQAFDLSEKLRVPILMRVTTRMAHSRAMVVTADEQREQNAHSLPANPQHFILLPAFAKRNYADLLAQQPEFVHLSEECGNNTYTRGTNPKRAIVACGIAYNYMQESGAVNGASILKITHYPLPVTLINRMVADGVEEILVAEEGQPVVEELLRGLVPSNITIRGRLTGDLPRMGELSPDCFVQAKSQETKAKSDLILPGRPPSMCQGCGHRDMYTALNEVAREYPEPRIFGDIGCYTLGALSPFHAIHACVEMGASITMAKGAADAGQYPSVAVIGDSTFTHSGMTGLLDCANCNADVVVLISDNLTTGMTGGQDSAGTGKLERICMAMGIPEGHVRVVVPLAKNMDEMKQVIREEINYHGTSVVIARRECIQTLKRKARK
ncbi:MAG: indolepyruvate ferredoxin oxidoreductase [Paludibacteraceae bacterium]|nr:indolepyruvate ferredoxin oxidoreductase [Paludibacteraceae bacterium]